MAGLLTLLLLAINLSLQVYAMVSWRGAIFGESYVAIPLILVLLSGIIWFSAYVWDVRMKMWREQVMVAIERNPYAKEKMSAKEIATFEMLWVPILEDLGQHNPVLKKNADWMKRWLERSSKDDPVLAGDVMQLHAYVDGIKG